LKQQDLESVFRRVVRPLRGRELGHSPILDRELGLKFSDAVAESLDLAEQASARVSSVLEAGEDLQQGEPRQGDGVDESALGHVMPVLRDRNFRCLAHVSRIPQAPGGLALAL
jgi:hypothetical protein